MISVKTEKELTVTGRDVMILGDLLEFAGRYMEKHRNLHNPLVIDEFSKSEYELFRVKLHEFLEAIR